MIKHILIVLGLIQGFRDSNGSPVPNSLANTTFQYPSEAVMIRRRFETEYSCCGTLINPNWVLTSANCVPEVINNLYVTSQNHLNPEEVVSEHAVQSVKKPTTPDSIALIEITPAIKNVDLSRNSQSVELASKTDYTHRKNCSIGYFGEKDGAPIYCNGKLTELFTRQNGSTVSINVADHKNWILLVTYNSYGKNSNSATSQLQITVSSKPTLHFYVSRTTESGIPQSDKLTSSNTYRIQTKDAELTETPDPTSPHPKEPTAFTPATTKEITQTTDTEQTESPDPTSPHPKEPTAFTPATTEGITQTTDTEQTESPDPTSPHPKEPTAFTPATTEGITQTTDTEQTESPDPTSPHPKEPTAFTPATTKEITQTTDTELTETPDPTSPHPKEPTAFTPATTEGITQTTELMQSTETESTIIPFPISSESEKPTEVQGSTVTPIDQTKETEKWVDPTEHELGQTMRLTAETEEPVDPTTSKTTTTSRQPSTYETEDTAAPTPRGSPTPQTEYTTKPFESTVETEDPQEPSAFPHPITQAPTTTTSTTTTSTTTTTTTKLSTASATTKSSSKSTTTWRPVEKTTPKEDDIRGEKQSAASHTNILSTLAVLACSVLITVGL